MGSIWLDGRTGGYPPLDAVCRGAGLNVQLYSGWQTRSRSSGGFEKLLGVVAHHTASPPSQSFQSCWDYCAVGHQDAPVANILLGRNGEVGIHAAGASNHAGKGGGSADGGGTTWVCSNGTVPADSANSHCFGIEAQNNGTGELWSPTMVTAYETLVAALCSAYHLNPITDIRAHFEWTPPRKIDPWGGSSPTPGFGYTGPREWIMDGFRTGVSNRMSATPVDDDEVFPHLASMYRASR